MKAITSPELAVVGTGAWGATLAIHAARLGVPVALLARSEDEAARLRRAGEVPRLPGVPFPDGLDVTHEAARVLPRSAVVLMVPPAQTMRQNLRAVAPHLARGAIVVSASKGLEIGSALRMTEVMAQQLPPALAARVAALSGPNLAKEVAAGKPSTTVVACADEDAAQRVQALLMAPNLRVYTHTDVVGVELGGALKNIIALGAGMSDGLDAGDNAKAALMTRGLAEIARLGLAAGAQPLTFSGLAGLGDLIATCTSHLSRNWTVGNQLARGRPLAAIQADLGQVAEGVTTTVAARQLAARFGVEMPIAELMHRVLFENLSPRAAGAALMQRDPKNELEGLL
jgi:glycerol-3-phosphate dehydrogenase (NAD(P)+)